MEFQKLTGSIAYIPATTCMIHTLADATDLIGNVHYHTGCNGLVLPKEAFCEDFYDLKTRVAGEILQKFVTYNMRIAIFGDFSQYTSKSLRDFIYESNKGSSVGFLPTMEAAIAFLEK